MFIWVNFTKEMSQTKQLDHHENTVTDQYIVGHQYDTATL